MESSDVVEAAARALINQRCAAAFLHDVRGSMQALFSAFDLLSRAARVSLGNQPRVDKACDLAQRAIAHHEKTTLQIFQVLTLQRSEPAIIELGTLVHEAIHFLRNDASTKTIVLKLSVAAEISIRVERNTFQAMMAGLLSSAIDHSPPGRELTVEVTERDGEALITIGSDAGYLSEQGVPPGEPMAGMASDSKRMTLSFARYFLGSNGGRVEIDPARGTPGARGAVRIFYPLVMPARLPPHAYRPERSNTPTGDDL